jgi:hypothetical protein
MLKTRVSHDCVAGFCHEMRNKTMRPLSKPFEAESLFLLFNSPSTASKMSRLSVTNISRYCVEHNSCFCWESNDTHKHIPRT